jgi:hypothetical protein
MKRLFPVVLAYGMILRYSDCAGQGKVNYSDSIWAQKLRRLYSLSTSENSKGARQEFFYSFPGNFQDLNRLYGYNGSKRGPLYMDAVNHISYLFKDFAAVKDTIFYKKIIDISIGGHWEADAINYFRKALKEKVGAKPYLVFYLLKRIQGKQIGEFWFFYFDEPLPANKIPGNLLFIKETDKNMYELMEQSLKAVQKSWERM